MVYTFRSMRHEWEMAAETVTRGYTTEMLEYREEHPPPTLREFLRMRRVDHE